MISSIVTQVAWSLLSYLVLVAIFSLFWAIGWFPETFRGVLILAGLGAGADFLTDVAYRIYASRKVMRA